MLTSTNIDILIVLFVVIFAVVGYFRGFILRLYDLIVTVVAIGGAYYVSGPVSLLFTSDSGTSFEFVNLLFNRIVAFLVLLAIFKIALSFVSLLVKPMLQKVADLPLVGGINRLLGAAISVMEALLIVYVLLLSLGSTQKDLDLGQTTIAKQILALAPDYSKQFSDYVDSLDLLDSAAAYSSDGLDGNSVYYVALALNTAYEHDYITQETLNEKAYNYFSQVASSDLQLELSADQVAEVEKLLDLVPTLDKNSILNKIEVING